MAYNFKDIEKKWQDKWEKDGTFNAKEDYTMKKWFGLIEFPYPSGQGLHVGHPRSFTALDIIARKRRLQGYNVLYPIGFDAFGLPAENYAIKTNVHPKITTAQNIENFTKQLKSLGISFDWSRKIDTTDPNYYKWTQWIFIQLFKHGLAYKATMPINFCTGCKVGLANEEVVNGVCERCGSAVVQKEKSEWMLKITDYAQRLIDDLDDVDFLEKIKIQQKNWIGRSDGADVDFAISGIDKTLKVYTTRPDTLFGSTYMVISPEHPILEELADKIENIDEVKKYQEQASLKSAFERSELNKEKTGIEIKGFRAINPVNGKEIPIWISDYVLITYGTGAIMAVPAHDTRDYEFATKFGIDIIPVLDGGDISKEPFLGDGPHINSDFLNGLNKEDAIKKIISWLEDKNIGTKQVNYKLRDWVFSRQRYWGEPIPMVYCKECGWVPIDEKELPLKLPDIKEFTPGENGESPLAKQTEWINTTCPHCGKPAKRETDTMPQWAGSSWYFLRYMDPHNNEQLASKEALDYWSPIDW
ncbi:MAG: leucine--tRNA ligase, partial [Clostridia bacterium]|nr:leucine--tRNA ligase [Clostridia bacterium]